MNVKVNAKLLQSTSVQQGDYNMDIDFVQKLI